MKIELQLELELTAVVGMEIRTAVAEALEFHAKNMRHDTTIPRHGITQVPHGQLSYLLTIRP